MCVYLGYNQVFEVSPEREIRNLFTNEKMGTYSGKNINITAFYVGITISLIAFFSIATNLVKKALKK